MTALALPPRDVLDGALCAQTDPELFFPELGGSGRAAKAVCRRCPVRDECLDWALANNELFGVFGGLSERERRRLKKQRAAEEGGPTTADNIVLACRPCNRRKGHY